MNIVGATDLALADGSTRLSPSGSDRRLQAGAREDLILSDRSMAFGFQAGHTGPMESGLKIETEWSRSGRGGGGFEVYRGKGRHARRLYPSASGGIIFSIFMSWLRGKA